MKYIVFDMDDTLLNGSGKVTGFTLDVLKKLQSMGHRIVINTARSKQFNQEFFDCIQPDYAILNGGALILDSRENVIFKAEIPNSVVRQMIEELLGVTRVFSVQTEEHLYTNNEEYTNQDAVYFDFAARDFSDPALKVVASIRDEKTAVALAEKYDLAYVSYFGGDFKRYNHKEATKARGNRNLAEIAGADLQDFLVFGDDLGDLDMIREAGVGVLMKNAKESLHSLCPHVSTYTNDEDGVARFLTEYFQLT